MKSTSVTKGSRNIFRDLGFSEVRSAELVLNSRLLQALQETIRERGWKQVETASRLDIDQANVSKLLAGQLAGFSVDRLVHFLSMLGGRRGSDDETSAWRTTIWDGARRGFKAIEYAHIFLTGVRVGKNSHRACPSWPW